MNNKFIFLGLFVVVIAVILFLSFRQEPRVEINKISTLLEEQEFVNVIISLKQSSTEDTETIQNRVLSTLDEEDFKLKIKYESVPALAGQISESGLVKLENNKDIEAISLDVGGEGG